MLKAKVKDFVGMMIPDYLIQEDPFTQENVTQEEYVSRHGEECVIGFWIVEYGVIGLYCQSEEEFDYWNKQFEE